ncbi:MAG: hypothetical protein LQ346_003073 [Caloplaca aetnensis]|nr:MAG: hypothetical protein LQ346_003073 [Caloplaca aetnensis]
MASASEPAYFAKARQAGRPVVRDLPKFDLDAYIANYKGKTRFARLLHIGTISTLLAPEALRYAVAEAKQGRDIRRYDAAVSAIREIMPGDRNVTADVAWKEKVQKQIKAESDRLETELKGYKNNLIKESIRMGYDDLGQHYHRTGELVESVKAFGRMRDFCTTPSHVVVMNLRLISVSIDQGNWLAVQTNVQKLRSPGQQFAEAQRLAAKLSAAMGLALLASGSYREAAQEFIDTDPRMTHARLDDPTDEEAFNEVMTPNDVAVYGGLCALASMDRTDLQKKILENNKFRSYLELEPHIRRAITFFVSSKFSLCLSILDSYRSDYMLDIHLQQHLGELYSQIRSKAIQQYFVPFSCATFAALGAAFDTDEQTIEQELTDMVKRGSLDARIDLVDRVLVARTLEARRNVHEHALQMAKEYERTAHLRILRTEIIHAVLEVADKGKALGSGIALDHTGGGEQLYGNSSADPFFGERSGRSLRSGLRG